MNETMPIFGNLCITTSNSTRSIDITGFIEAVLTSTHNLCFEKKYEKYPYFYMKIFIFLVVKFSVYLNRRVFVMSFCRSIFVLYFDKLFFVSPFQVRLLKPVPVNALCRLSVSFKRKTTFVTFCLVLCS